MINLNVGEKSNVWTLDKQKELFEEINQEKKRTFQKKLPKTLSSGSHYYNEVNKFVQDKLKDFPRSNHNNAYIVSEFSSFIYCVIPVEELQREELNSKIIYTFKANHGLPITFESHHFKNTEYVELEFSHNYHIPEEFKINNRFPKNDTLNLKQNFTLKNITGGIGALDTDVYNEPKTLKLLSINGKTHIVWPHRKNDFRIETNGDIKSEEIKTANHTLNLEDLMAVKNGVFIKSNFKYKEYFLVNRNTTTTKAIF